MSSIEPQASASVKNVALGVCGGIAAYKAVEVLRGLQKAGCNVRVAMTRRACDSYCRRCEILAWSLTIQQRVARRLTSIFVRREIRSCAKSEIAHRARFRVRNSRTCGAPMGPARCATTRGFIRAGGFQEEGVGAAEQKIDVSRPMFSRVVRDPEPGPWTARLNETEESTSTPS